MLRILPAVLAAFLVATATAQAADYCVGAPAACPPGATSFTADQLQDALTAAQASATVADDVWIGPGEYVTANGFTYSQTGQPLNDLRIHGAGKAATLLRADAPKGSSFYVLALEAEGSDQTKVSHLTIEAPAGISDEDAATGVLLTKAAAEDVDVRTVAGAINGARTGIKMGADSRLARATVSLTPHGGVVIGVWASSGGIVIEDLTVTSANWGLYADGVAAGRAERVNLTAKDAPLACVGCDDLDVVNAVLRPSSAGDGVLAQSFTGAPAVLQVSHATIVGPAGSDTSTGATVKATGNDNVTLSIDNSIITETNKAIDRAVSAGSGAANVISVSSSYDAATNTSTGTGSLSETGITNDPPVFADAANGDFHLAPNAPQVDRGRAVPFVAATLDIDREDRTVNGVGDTGDEPDQGADEYQALAPVATITGADAGVEESPLTVSGAASTTGGDPGDSIVSYAWDFGDSSLGNGAVVEHSYADPGTYTVTLTVTDRGGRSATTTRQVTVAAKPAPAVPATPTATPAPIATPRPVVDRAPPTLVATLRATTFRRGRGTTVRIGVSERARVRIQFTRKGRVVKTTTRSLRAGTTTVNLRSLTRRLRAASYTLRLIATDAAGNRSRTVSLKARITR